MDNGSLYVYETNVSSTPLASALILLALYKQLLVDCSNDDAL